MEQLLPTSHLDRVLEDVQRPPEARRSFQEYTSTTIEETTTQTAVITQKMEHHTSDYSDGNDTDFVLVDYGEGGQIELNQTVPRVIIRVENNMHQPISELI